MKKATVVLLATLLLAATAQASQWTAWLGAQTDITEARIGYMVKPTIELGVTCAWKQSLPKPRKIGGYGFYHHPEPVTVTSPIPIAGVDTIESYPYGGIEVFADLGETGGMGYCAIAGLNHFGFIHTEFRYGKIGPDALEVDENQTAYVVGINYRF